MLYIRPIFLLTCDYTCGECWGEPDGRDVIIDMYKNPEVTFRDGTMYDENIPDCFSFVTNQQNHPQQYTKETLLPFNKLKCNHGNLGYQHEGWAIEDGVAECYDNVKKKYKELYKEEYNEESFKNYITCAYRCPVKNKALNSSVKNSAHLIGKAFDFDAGSDTDSHASEINWHIARSAYLCNKNYTVLVYTDKNQQHDFTEFIDNNVIPTNPPKFIEHGHVGVN